MKSMLAAIDAGTCEYHELFESLYPSSLGLSAPIQTLRRFFIKKLNTYQ